MADRTSASRGKSTCGQDDQHRDQRGMYDAHFDVRVANGRTSACSVTNGPVKAEHAPKDALALLGVLNVVSLERLQFRDNVRKIFEKQLRVEAHQLKSHCGSRRVSEALAPSVQGEHSRSYDMRIAIPVQIQSPLSRSPANSLYASKTRV